MACVDSSGRGYPILVVGRDDAPDAAITRDEAQTWFTRFLLRRVGRNEYPSTTQLDLSEKSIPRERLDEYLRVLVDKVAHDRFPSVPLLRRIQHLIECLPHTGHPHPDTHIGHVVPDAMTPKGTPNRTSRQCRQRPH